MKYEAVRSEEPQTHPSETYNAEIGGEKHKNRVETNTEILESPSAQAILPYLTLDKLDERIEVDLFTLSSEVLDAMQRGILPKDKFTRVATIENIVADISGETDSWGDGRITPKLGQARKLFCATLLNSMGDDNSTEKKWEIYNSLFGISPGLDSFCGGLQGSLELLMIAKRTNYSPFTNKLCDEIIYDYSFSETNGFRDVFEESGPIKQLRLLPVFNGLALRCDPNGWNNGALNKITELLDATKANPDATPLVKLVAEGVEQNISDWFNSEWIEIDTSNPEHAKMVARHEQKVKDNKREQERLHDEFPNLPIDQYLIRIAPDCAATLNGDTVNMISNSKGDTASLLKYQQENPFGLNRDMAFLISAAHNPGISELISAKLGMKLNDISFEAQKHLLKYMTEADNERFNRLCDTLQTVDKKLRLKLVEGFIAADFGEDFGDCLLTIAGSERLSGKEKEKIFDTLSSCRESIETVTSLYEGFDDGEFTKEYKRAANERLTDAVTVFSAIAKNGKVGADLGWPGKMEYDYDSAMEALGYEAKSLEIISGTISDVVDKKEGTFAEIVLHPDLPGGQRYRTVYNFYSPQHGYVLLYTRPEGSHSFDERVEYGKQRSRYDEKSVNTGVEASISFITNPVDPFSLPNPFKPDPRAAKNPRFYDSTTMDKVSALRIDREGRAPDMAVDDPRRDPINSKGTVSVDLAAIGDRKDTPSGKIARLLSTGGILREQGSSGTSLNHNTKWFKQEKYGTAEGFSNLVKYIDKKMGELVRSCVPGDNAESFTRRIEREIKRNRGRKVTGKTKVA